MDRLGLAGSFTDTYLVESSTRSSQLLIVIAVIIIPLQQTNRLGEIADLVHLFVPSGQGKPGAKQHFLIRIVVPSVIAVITVIGSTAIELQLPVIVDIQETTLAFTAIIRVVVEMLRVETRRQPAY